MKNTNPKVLSGTISGTTPIVGAAIDASQMYQASFQFTTVDTLAAGTYKIQMSNDPQPNGTFAPNTFTHWSDIASASATVTANTQAAAIILLVVTARALRVVFTPTAGSGTAVVNMFSINV